ncbi:hypothetical protein [Streptomyces sp. NBC_00690]|uniref:hypothetical protein n=1 Tax=Streptomyces sp. NBC_00690 TaxID=2975808 RepID=UPI002E2B128C|nr:hypothetical protein [Streptomyces sp. NBC_00690]
MTKESGAPVVCGFDAGPLGLGKRVRQASGTPTDRPLVVPALRCGVVLHSGEVPARTRVTVVWTPRPALSIEHDPAGAADLLLVRDRPSSSVGVATPEVITDCGRSPV